MSLAQIVGAIFRKSLRLSGRARMSHSVGQITTMISTDATRLDRSAQFMHKYDHGSLLYDDLRLIMLLVYGLLRYK